VGGPCEAQIELLLSPVPIRHDPKALGEAADRAFHLTLMLQEASTPGRDLRDTDRGSTAIDGIVTDHPVAGTFHDPDDPVGERFLPRGQLSAPEIDRMASPVDRAEPAARIRHEATEAEVVIGIDLVELRSAAIEPRGRIVVEDTSNEPRQCPLR
jgi:hypothetical protein